ncbi:MAG: autotransporter assembly complex protein TamA [Alphaproteobacteria bacterium]
MALRAIVLSCALVVLGLTTVPPAAGAQDSDRAARELSYKVRFSGFEDSGLEKILRDHADLIRFKDEPPSSIWDLRARITRDLTTFATVLRSEGYYGARLSYDLLRRERPIVVQIRGLLGDRFKVSSYNIDLTGAGASSDEIAQLAQTAANRLMGKPSRNEEIVAAYQSVLNALPERAYPQVSLTNRRVRADHITNTVYVQVDIDTGPRVQFGDVSVEGLESVREGVVLKEVPWKPGEPFDQREVEAFRQDLVEQNLFASITIDTDGPLDQHSRQPVVVRVEEAEHRTIGIGASYSSSKGFGGEVFWEHRNFRGRGETLLVSAKADEQKQSLQTDFIKPRFLRRDQKLFLGVEGLRDDTDAFLEYTGELSGAVEREISPRWKVRLGGELAYSDIRDQESNREFFLFGVPALVAYDGSNDLLDPTRGMRLTADVTPYLSVDGGADFFTTVELTGSFYLPLDDRARYVAAARTRIGFLVGPSTSEVPATKRFFAGGGASIRGYEFQAVGPLDAEGDPLGGRSVFEIGAELRIKISESWGIVPFVEGGNVFDASYPDFSRQLRWAGGIGLRYYTAFGPIRLDVGFPINPRPRDDTFQIYISIGQSF